MFTIDLRKGQGLPPKSRPILVGLAVVPLLVPLLGLLVTVVCWQQNSALIRTQQDIIRENQNKISGMQNNLKLYQKTDEQINLCNQRLNDVSGFLKYRIQTTPILVEIVGNLPEFLTLAALDLDRTEQRKQATSGKTDSPNTGPVIQRKMKMTVSGPANDTTDIAVKDYVQNLSQSPALSKWIDMIRIISRKSESVDDRNYSLYEIECAMKDQI